MNTNKLVPAAFVCATIAVIGATFGAPSFAAAAAAAPAPAGAESRYQRAGAVPRRQDSRAANVPQGSRRPAAGRARTT